MACRGARRDGRAAEGAGLLNREFPSLPVLSCHDTPGFPPFSDGNASPLSRPIPPRHDPSGANSGAKKRGPEPPEVHLSGRDLTRTKRSPLSIVADRALFNGFSIWVGEIHRSTVELNRAAPSSHCYPWCGFFFSRSPGVSRVRKKGAGAP